MSPAEVIVVCIFVSKLSFYFLAALRVSRAVTRLTVYRAPKIMQLERPRRQMPSSNFSEFGFWQPKTLKSPFLFKERFGS